MARMWHKNVWAVAEDRGKEMFKSHGGDNWFGRVEQ